MALLAVPSTSVLAQSEGGGAALGQVFGMTAAAGVVSIVLLWIGYLHRTRKITWLARLADWAAGRLHRPPWAALPMLFFVTTIVCALFGFIWDVSLHIGKGRDSGPLANPAHYFILIGLFFLFIAGMLAVFLPYEKPGAAAIRITRTWHAPIGGVLLAACGLYALIGFPLDDIWHRIFGQDVTLWGPTHLMLIGGAGLSLIALLLLEREGRAAAPSDAERDGLGVWLVRCAAFGGLLIGLSVFQIEYDFGVEQFRLVLQPMLIAAAGALALVAARLTLGMGAAILAALIAAAIRGAVALVVGPGLGAPLNVFTLYAGAAIVVELIAFTPLVRKPIIFGAVAGLGVATLGLLGESWWIDAVYHYPWPTSMWGEGLAMAIPVAIATGICGGLLGMVLTGRPLPSARASGVIVALTVLIVGGAVYNGLRTEVPDATATITLTPVPGDGGEHVSAEVRLEPADVVGDNPEWVSILSWQGGLDNQRGLNIDVLERTGPGEYRSTTSIPVYGDWKTLLRIQDGTTMAGVPIYLPADPGIGAEGYAAQPKSTEPFVEEIKILQRERNFDHPSWLYSAASLVVLICSLIIIAALSWGAWRINSSGSLATSHRRPTVPSS
ncbi:hypothetical protein [Aldersonia kunmingensis]|uniref:hypothetical protein n=1 Tax=Aldersonia kunmingensis TaxID=408066 RepID=UPI00083354F3|nr:hypothetical protein [Aldersonia kunmingensis]